MRALRVHGVDDLCMRAFQNETQPPSMSMQHEAGLRGNKLESPYLLPGGNLGVVPNPGRVGHPGRLGRDEGRLGDEERAGDGRALLVVLDDEVRRDVRVAGSVAGEGREDDAVAELYVPNLDRGEQRGSGVSGHASNLVLMVLEARVRRGADRDNGEGEDAPPESLDDGGHTSWVRDALRRALDALSRAFGITSKRVHARRRRPWGVRVSSACPRRQI